MAYICVPPPKSFLGSTMWRAHTRIVRHRSIMASSSLEFDNKEERQSFVKAPNHITWEPIKRFTFSLHTYSMILACMGLSDLLPQWMRLRNHQSSSIFTKVLSYICLGKCTRVHYNPLHIMVGSLFILMVGFFIGFKWGTYFGSIHNNSASSTGNIHINGHTPTQVGQRKMSAAEAVNALSVNHVNHYLGLSLAELIQILIILRLGMPMLIKYNI